MLKLPNSIEPAVMAENIVHLRDGLAAVDAKTLPATTSATTGQILKLTGETKMPAWADEYSYTPPAYSTTETATGQKWIDGKDIYFKVFNGTLSDTVNTQTTIGNITADKILWETHSTFKDNVIKYSRVDYTAISVALNGDVNASPTTSAATSRDVIVIVYYTKPDPTPGRAPEDQEPEPEEKKTTKKKTTK